MSTLRFTAGVGVSFSGACGQGVKAVVPMATSLHSVTVGRRVVYHSIGEMRRVVMITITIPGIGNRLKLERETQNSVVRAFGQFHNSLTL